MANLPVIILVNPQLGENIGAVARAMSNFGLSELRLVAPRDGWPNRRALETASGAADIIASARVFSDTVSAMADIGMAYGTTARPRDMEKRVIDPATAAQEIKALSAKKSKVALLFGPERTGLTNDDINWCNTLITIPTAPENSSLNLAQSVVILLYEWQRQKSGKVEKHLPAIAPKGDWQELFKQLEIYLDDVNYYRVAHKKPLMWQNLQNMLLRGAWSTQEIQTFRGILRVLKEGRQPRKRRVSGKG